MRTIVIRASVIALMFAALAACTSFGAAPNIDAGAQVHQPTSVTGLDSGRGAGW